MPLITIILIALAAFSFAAIIFARCVATDFSKPNSWFQERCGSWKRIPDYPN
eukprot:UN27063